MPNPLNMKIKTLIFSFLCLVVSLSILITSSQALLSTKDHAISKHEQQHVTKLELANKNDNNNPNNELKTYIVHVKKPSSNTAVPSKQDLSSWYQSFLPNRITNGRRAHIIHEYRTVATGFAAALTPSEAGEMAKKEGCLSVKEQKIYSLHTTHTPNFLGLQQGIGLWAESKLGQGVIVGVLDTGIWPDRASFDDTGIPPPPPKWKGKCNFNGTVCNNKLIGARDFVGGGSDAPPFDGDGHGTHTSSTAAGNFVAGANVYGSANGTAAGMAPHAHVAMYRVCEETCTESDILAAIEAAVEDGVDVLSLSLGGGSVPFYADGIAVGAFAAISKGIFVSCSAGNDGPDYGTLSNEAPWILTVGAATVDRKIAASAILGNGKILDGESLFQTSDIPSSPLIYSGAGGDQSAAFCSPGSLAKLDVKGKIVACDRGGGVARLDKGKEVKSAGGAGMILMNAKADGFSTLADAHVLPATHVSFASAIKLKSYLNSTQNPTAAIKFRGTIIGDSHAPSVSSFSSRGPSIASTGILKPDVVGPGVSILAAWPVSVDNSSTAGTSTFNMVSGTSMSCPHLAGVAALLKSSHPEWSPAAIKSAMMTTADVLNLGGKPILDEKASPADVFAIGSGQINPPKADNPGLIYDIAPSDYVPYLCGLNYSDDEVSLITQTTVVCSEVKIIPETQLNYPSFSVVLGSESQSYTRTVTNVGEANTVYTLDLDVPTGIGMNVNPSTLTFTEVNQKIEFSVEFIPQSGGGLTFSQGYLRWVSDNYSVRSQISVIFV